MEEQSKKKEVIPIGYNPTHTERLFCKLFI